MDHKGQLAAESSTQAMFEEINSMVTGGTSEGQKYVEI
jgi:hypothetical protein